MKISSERSLIDLEAYIKNAQSSDEIKSSRGQEQGKAIQTERVKLSPKARDLQKIREVMEATPEIREEKVGQFKREIEAGTYSVKGDKVAERMVRESLIDAFI